MVVGESKNFEYNGEMNYAVKGDFFCKVLKNFLQILHLFYFRWIKRDSRLGIIWMGKNIFELMRQIVHGIFIS